MMIKKINKKLCKGCPVASGSPKPCQAALERVHRIQLENASKKEITPQKEECPWAINSIDHKYCFWLLVQDMDAPLTDKEICQLEGITQKQLNETFASALRKLKRKILDPVMVEWKEMLLEYIQSTDSDINRGEFISEGYEQIESIGVTEDEEDLKHDDEDKILDDIQKLKSGRKVNLFGMPLHRYGKKVDLYGLGSSKVKKSRKADASKRKNKPKL